MDEKEASQAPAVSSGLPKGPTQPPPHPWPFAQTPFHHHGLELCQAWPAPPHTPQPPQSAYHHPIEQRPLHHSRSRGTELPLSQPHPPGVSSPSPVKHLHSGSPRCLSGPSPGSAQPLHPSSETAPRPVPPPLCPLLPREPRCSASSRSRFLSHCTLTASFPGDLPPFQVGLHPPPSTSGLRPLTWVHD